MKVALVDGHKAFRESLKIALLHEASIQVIAEAGTAREIYGALEAEPPDLFVSEMMLTDTDGISVARELQRRGVVVPMMILTMHSNVLFVRDALEAGVQAYALKDEPLSEIIGAMRTAAQGRRYVSPLLGEVAVPAKPGAARVANGTRAGLGRLSHREREVFCRIIQGFSSRDIADALCISLKTVETHRTHINRKLGVHSPAELIRLAAIQGLLKTDAVARAGAAYGTP